MWNEPEPLQLSFKKKKKKNKKILKIFNSIVKKDFDENYKPKLLTTNDCDLNYFSKTYITLKNYFFNKN